jgi:hypothetical protein
MNADDFVDPLAEAEVASDIAVVVEIHKSTDVPAPVSVTTSRVGRSSLLPLNVESAHVLGGLLDAAVRFLRPVN